jgi:succinoglycan biosynthesis transport protein ExoP
LRPAQLSAQEVMNVLHRRKKYLFFPFLIVVIVCTLGAFLLPRQYESSTTILVQRDEILNPLVNFTMAVSMASEDRIRTFNEIVFSKSAIQMVIDSLQLDKDIKTDIGKEDLVKQIKKNIETGRPGSATFRISFVDTDPVRAQRGTYLLAHYFIRQILQAENQRNELAVQFFEKKLNEFQNKFETKQKEMVDILRNRIQEMPVENQTLLANVEDLNKQIIEIDERLKEYHRGLTLLQQFSGNLSADGDKQMLLGLQRMDLPHIAELHPLVTRYEEYSRRYTSKYPEVQKLNSQIIDLLGIIQNGIEQEISKQRKTRPELEHRRMQIVDNLKQTSAAQQIDKDKRSNFDIVRNLYDEMQVKLEQARTNRDLGRAGNEQFVLLDPPLVPIEAAKPNRTLIIAGGLGVGLLLGIFSAALSELLDPTIRTARDVGVYRKRIIAYLPEGTAEHIS